MPLQILPVTPADIPALHTLLIAAFDTDPYHTAVKPRIHEPAFRPWYHARLLRAIHDPASAMLKVVDPDAPGEILAHARWILPQPEPSTTPESNPTDKAKEESKEKEPVPDIPPPPCINTPLLTTYLARVDALHAAHIRPRHDFILQMLATAPAHQGRGAAGLLMRWGLERADAAHARVFLEATPRGHGVYRRFGFVDVEAIEVEMEGEGGKGRGMVPVMVFMRREAKGCAGQDGGGEGEGEWIPGQDS